MKINRILQIMLIFSIPFLLMTGAIRLLINPNYAKFEYQHAWFPKDAYGMQNDERLKWSRYAINYLVNDEEISYLSDLRFEDGEAVFLERELDHMVDVKQVIKISLAVWYGLLGFLFATTIWFLVIGGKNYLNQALNWGSWITIGLIVAILLMVIISFNQLFEWFHKLFFEDGTWLFYHDDTLIRLFPLEFWRDAFVIVSVLTILFASVILVFSFICKKRITKRNNCEKKPEVL